ncbi:sortase-dependent protein [Streptomyces sp. NPDC006012]|uniref:sortase-dependent protein n=1 Tax=Streptomyces sp. NPDC006012 TaxID=3364739 RepID=UPI00368648F8
MRRTVLTLAAFAATAVLAGAAPAFADGPATPVPAPARDATPVPAQPRDATPVPSSPRDATPVPSSPRDATPVPSSPKGTDPAQTRAGTSAPSPVPSPATRAPGQVTVVPKGAPDTGVVAPSSASGSWDGLLGGGAAAALVAAGGAVFVVRRRRAAGTTGA